MSELCGQENGVNQHDIYVYGDPKWSVLGFRSDTLNPYLIADELEARGWKLNLLQNPVGFHLCLTHVHTLVEEFDKKFINDLHDAIVSVKQYSSEKKPGGNVKVYGAVGMMPSAVQEEICIQYQKARLSYEARNKLGLFAPIPEEPIVNNAQIANNTM